MWLCGLTSKDLFIFFLLLTGTWQTYVVKEQSLWYKIDKNTPMEYAATVIVNPLTALRMLEDFVVLKSGISISPQLLLCSLQSPVSDLCACVGDSIVQNGATSIVGQCIIQLARVRGIHSLNIIRDRYLN